MEGAENPEQDGTTDTNAGAPGRGWTCARCTYLNLKPLSLACDLCRAERPSGDGRDEGAVVREVLRREDGSRPVREDEAERSRAEFDGFDIYMGSSRRTGTLPHLT